MNQSLKRVCTLCRRNIKEILREPLSLVFLLLLPLGMLVLFYFLFHNAASQFEMKYLVPGIIVFSQSFATLFTGLLISVDKNSSFLVRLFVTKAKSYEFIFGYSLALIPLMLFQTLLFLIVGGIIDTSLWSINMVVCCIASIIPALLFIAFGLLFGTLCSEKSVGGISSIIITGQSILSGMWFPLEALSAGFITVLNCLPFRNASLLLQNILSGYNSILNDILLPLFIVIGYTILIFGLAIMFFHNKMRKL